MGIYRVRWLSTGFAWAVGLTATASFVLSYLGIAGKLLAAASGVALGMTALWIAGKNLSRHVGTMVLWANNLNAIDNGSMLLGASDKEDALSIFARKHNLLFTGQVFLCTLIACVVLGFYVGNAGQEMFDKFAAELSFKSGAQDSKKIGR